MSGLIGGIISQAQSLNAQSTGLEIAGKNLANVNNDNYARQNANIVTNDSGGAEVASISSTRNNLIDTQIMNELMTQNSLNAQSDIGNTLQSLLGEHINTATDQSQSTGSASGNSSTGVFASIDAFFNSFNSLAANPTESAQKQQVIAAGQTMVDQLNYLSTSIGKVDSDVSAQITSQTTDAQTLLSQIADYNNQIARTEIGKPGSALDLRDQRQASIEALSKLMNFTVQPSSKGLGQVQIVAPATGGGSVTLLDGPIVKGSLSYNSGTGVFSGGIPSAALDITGGSMAGYQNVRSGLLSNLKSGLNTLSSNLVSSVNNIYNPGSSGNNFFLASGTTAGTIALDPTLTPSSLKTGTSSDAGANDIAQGIADLGTTPIGGLGGNTFGSYYNSQVTAVGQKISTLNSQIGSNTLVFNMLQQQRQSISGVSTDQEMTSIMVFQRAYQGNAHVISVMDTLLDAVVNSLGHF